MKKKIILLLMMFSFLLCLSFTNETNSFPLVGKLIILDPGHGYLDPGCVYKDEYEKDYNLSFARILKYSLEEKGATVILTRDGDYDLSDASASSRKKSDFDNRIKIINESEADLYLSLHMNYLNDTSYFGSQAFYSDVNDNNEELANILQTNFNSFFEFDKPAKEIGEGKYMYSKVNITGVLIEYGFISSSKDRENLKNDEYLHNLTGVITDSIIDYFT